MTTNQTRRAAAHLLRELRRYPGNTIQPCGGPAIGLLLERGRIEKSDAGYRLAVPLTAWDRYRD